MRISLGILRFVSALERADTALYEAKKNGKNQ